MVEVVEVMEVRGAAGSTLPLKIDSQLLLTGCVRGGFPPSSLSLSVTHTHTHAHLHLLRSLFALLTGFNKKQTSRNSRQIKMYGLYRITHFPPFFGGVVLGSQPQRDELPQGSGHIHSHPLHHTPAHTYRPVQPPAAVHGDVQLAAHPVQGHHASLHRGDLY